MIQSNIYVSVRCIRGMHVWCSLYVEDTVYYLAYDHFLTYIPNIYHCMKTCYKCSVWFSIRYLGSVCYLLVQCLYNYFHNLKCPNPMKIWQLNTGWAGRKRKGLFRQCGWKNLLLSAQKSSFFKISNLSWGTNELSEKIRLRTVHTFMHFYLFFIWFICLFVSFFLCLFLYSLILDFTL